MTRLALTAVLLLAPGALAQKDGGAAPKADRRPLLAVLYFDVDDKAGELTVFRKGLAEMMISDLVQNDQVRVVERARLNDVLDELKLGQSGKVDPKTAVQVGRLLQAHYLVTGSIIPMGKKLIFTMRAIVVQEGQVIATSKELGTDEDVMAAEVKMVGELQARLAAHLQQAPPEAAKKEAVRLRYDTAVKYGQAQDLKDKNDKKAAAAKLTEVVKEQPDFVLARLDLLALTK